VPHRIVVVCASTALLASASTTTPPDTGTAPPDVPPVSTRASAFALLLTFTLTSALAACAGRYDVLESGTYECTATLVSTTCGPDLPTSTSSMDVDAAGDSFSTSPPGLPFPLNPTRMPGSSLQFGPQDDGFTYHLSGYSSCGDGTGGIDMEELAIITDFGEGYFVFRFIEDFSGATSCAYPDVTADTCRAERLVSCVAVP